MVPKNFMKLQGKVSRVYKGKEYMKQWVVVPNTAVDKLGWKKGDDLKFEVKDGNLVISKAD